MPIKSLFSIIVLLIISSSWATADARFLRFSHSNDRYSFPRDFMFGAASSAYQYEGAIDEDGKSQNMWDNFTHTYPERTNMDNGDVAVDFYHRFKEDIKLVTEMNMDAFRFSISWSRILPSGKLSDGVNTEGIRFYNNLIDELIANGFDDYDDGTKPAEEVLKNTLRTEYDEKHLQQLRKAIVS